MSISIVGYDFNCTSLILATDDGEVQRSLDDFKRLNRSVANSGGLPAQSFKKLAACGTWRKDATGWNRNMIRSVTLIENWLKELHGTTPTELEDFLSDEVHIKLKKSRVERKEAEANPKRLQQFFTNDQNISLLIDEVVVDSNIPMNEILFIEPSCGDGRVIRELINRGGRHFIACDIDEKMVQITDKLLSECREKDNSFEYTVLCSDFLITDASIITNPSNSRNHSFAVVVGNPPFSIIQDRVEVRSSSQSFDYSEVGRDEFPILFLKHCACLKVDKIVFLLPERCNQPSFIDKATRLLNEECGVTMKWYLKKSFAADSNYDFVGRNVKQPSVIQVWASTQS